MSLLVGPDVTFTPVLTDPAAARLGDWTFRAGQRNVSGAVEGAYLERGGERVPLVHSSGLLADFARITHLMQSDIDRRYEAACHA